MEVRNQAIHGPESVSREDEKARLAMPGLRFFPFHPPADSSARVTVVPTAKNRFRPSAARWMASAVPG